MPEAGPGQRVLLVLRPNEIELLPAGESGGCNVFDAIVEKATYLGDTMDYRLTFGQGLTLRVQTDAQCRFGAATPVRIRLPRIRCWAITTG